jgi:guanine deaminase
VGNFLVGKQFDAVRVNCAVEGSPFDVFSYESKSDLFQKFIFLGDDRNMVSVCVWCDVI